MNIEELRTNFTRLSHPETIEDCNEVIDYYCEFILQTVHRQKDDKVTDIEAHARILLQMMMTKLLHLKAAIAGVNFNSKTGIRLNKIVDFTIIPSLTRNIYETVGLFNLIFRANKLGDERTTVYNLWMISGLKYRQRFENIITTEENKNKVIAEQKVIDTCIEQIRRTSLYKALDEKEKEKLENQIKRKEFLVCFQGQKVRILSWKELYDVSGAKRDFFEHIYTFFSLYTHPSYVSVFQFRDSFQPESEAFIGMTTFNLKNVFMLMGIFVADYINLFPKSLEIFNSLPITQQAIINSQNVFARGYEHSINNSLEALG